MVQLQSAVPCAPCAAQSLDDRSGRAHLRYGGLSAADARVQAELRQPGHLRRDEPQRLRHSLRQHRRDGLRGEPVRRAAAEQSRPHRRCRRNGPERLPGDVQRRCAGEHEHPHSDRHCPDAGACLPRGAGRDGLLRSLCGLHPRLGRAEPHQRPDAPVAAQRRPRATVCSGWLDPSARWP